MTTFYRLLGFLRPYKRGLGVSWVLASLAMVMTVLMPYLMGQAVERVHAGTSAHASSPARAHDRHQLTLIAGAIVLAVFARWGLTYWRRMIAGRVSLGIEYDLRERLYRHLQGLVDRGRGGEHLGRAGGEVLRAGAAAAGALRRHGRPGVRSGDGGYAPRGQVQPDDRVLASARPGSGTASGRALGDPRASATRAVHGVLLLLEHAHRTDALARRHAGPRPACHRLGGPHLPGARSRAAPGRASARARAPTRRWARPPRWSHPALRHAVRRAHQRGQRKRPARRRPFAARRRARAGRSRRSGRAHGRTRGCHGIWQDEPRSALLA